MNRPTQCALQDPLFVEQQAMLKNPYVQVRLGVAKGPILND